MAHEISTVSGRPEMMYAGQEPWHGLGTYVGDKEVTSAEAIKAAGLDWEVRKVPAFFQAADGTFKPNGGFTTVRMDKQVPLGRVGDIYTPMQNKDAFKFMDDLIGHGGAYYHTAGALGRGERVWILVRFNGTEEVSKGDGVDSYLLLSNGHDGGTSLDIRLTTVRVVCANTLAMALSKREKGAFFTIRHTTNMAKKVGDVRDGLLVASDKFRKFIEAAKLLRGEEITRKELDDFLIQLEIARANEREDAVADRAKDFKKTTKYAELVRAFETSPGSDKAGTSLWGAVNAVTYYYDHVNAPKDTGRYGSVEERRLASTWFDNGADKKERAFALALEFAKSR